jgi:16S rRNA (guanine966-N2)-methyltransferase
VLECVQTDVCEGAYPTTVGQSDEMARPGKRNGQQGQLRIIGGQWRGRNLNFTPEEGLRPTSDRIRETLFNWLALSIHGTRCLDLFAGSGALGLEALSRGAAHCDFVDISSTAVKQINQHLSTLSADTRARSYQAPAQQFLENASQPYDIVFLDPPFDRQLVNPACKLLAQQRLVHQGTLVYVETGAMEPAPKVPDDWGLHREKVSGGVAYHLYYVSEDLDSL